jgi:hypothetical protein
MCWNKPAAPLERLVALASYRLSHHATSTARSTSCGWKYAETSA